MGAQAEAGPVCLLWCVPSQGQREPERARVRQLSPGKGHLTVRSKERAR